MPILVEKWERSIKKWNFPNVYAEKMTIEVQKSENTNLKRASVKVHNCRIEQIFNRDAKRITEYLHGQMTCLFLKQTFSF